MTYIIVGGFVALIVTLVHFYLSGIKKQNEKLRHEIEAKKQEDERRKVRAMPIDVLIKHANERRRARRQRDEKG